MFRKPIFWVAVILVSAGSIYFATRYFSKAFPLVTLDLQMNRETAVSKARELAAKCEVGPDGYDQAAWHLWTEQGGAIAAYLRILPARTKYAEASLGRVVTAPEHRRTGLGRELMHEGIRELAARCGDGPIRIGAQKYLERWYGELGFVRDGADYIEDGIPHLEMVRASAISS